MKKLIVFAVALGFILVLAVFASYYWYQSAISSPASESASPVVIEVEPGESIDAIAAKLEDAGVITEKEAFLLYAKLNPELVSKVQAGYFELEPRNSIKEIFVLLQKAKNKEDLRVTIPEGLRYDEIAEILSKAFATVPDSRFSKEEFLKLVESPDALLTAGPAKDFLTQYKPEGRNLEGFLYPDTYLFSKQASANTVVEKLVTTLAYKLTREDLAEIERSNFSLYEILNLASLIERESLAVSEDALIADVLIKRLEQGIDGVKLLQVDASLLYPVKDWKANAFLLKSVDNPYNTYKYPGLPPTPIANPGIAAIQAAIYPEPNDYFYYIHDNTGKIHFARTYSEHLTNVNKYL